MKNNALSNNLEIIKERIKSTYIDFTFTPKESNILNEICTKKAFHIENQKKIFSIDNLLDIIKSSPKPLGFLESIKSKHLNENTAIIAEIKKASPSAGLIRQDFSLIDIAKSYYDGGAACISVLTDEFYFQGQDAFINEVKKHFSIPILRKDFIIDPYQVIESRSLGADCILLIMSLLSIEQAKELEFIAKYLSMDILLEVHNDEDLEKAMSLNSSIIGINNRNLKTMKVDLSNTEKLSLKIPSNYTVVCESGIHNQDDILRIKSCGINTFLIGESLMRKKDIKAFLETLLTVK